MQKVKGRKQFVEPELIKFKEPLDHVTLPVFITMPVFSGGSTSEGGKNLDALKKAFHKIITGAKEQMGYRELSALYFYMARFALEEGKDTKPLIEKSREYELLWRAKILGSDTKVKVLSTADSCDGCKKLAGKTFTIQEALETMPIPRQCKGDICTCVYVASISDVI